MEKILFFIIAVEKIFQKISIKFHYIIKKSKNM